MNDGPTGKNRLNFSFMCDLRAVGPWNVNLLRSLNMEQLTNQEKEEIIHKNLLDEWNTEELSEENRNWINEQLIKEVSQYDYPSEAWLIDYMQAVAERLYNQLEETQEKRP